MFPESAPQITPDEKFRILMNALSNNPDLQKKMIPDIELIRELAPELERKVWQIATGLYGKINCHGTSLYLIGMTEKPKAVSPITGKNNEMSNYLKAMKKNETLQPGSLVCYKSYPGDGYSYIPHSGILLSSKRGSLFLLHKGGYNDPIKVEPVEEVFKDIKNIRGSQELESYSLK